MDIASESELLVTEPRSELMRVIANIGGIDLVHDRHFQHLELELAASNPTSRTRGKVRRDTELTFAQQHRASVEEEHEIVLSKLDRLEPSFVFHRFTPFV